jgi:hypothetical protein
MCPSRRTDKTVVDRIRRFVFMSAIFYYNSAACSPKLAPHQVAPQFEMEASQTRDASVAKNATLRPARGRQLRAARLDPSPRRKRLFRVTIKLSHYLASTVFSIGIGNPAAITAVTLRRAPLTVALSSCVDLLRY